ncbi:MAG: ParA family protein [Firmicutes bacterium]|nr:ParA family protein [Bacillota bacterium]
MGAYVIAFANQKGGVGKTTSCINIAASCASLGKRVLLIDSDPQGNSTSGLGINKKSLKATIYDGLIGTKTAEECIVHTAFERLDLVGSNIHLAGAEFELMDMEHREARLKNFIAEVSASYDLVVIDCPPSLSLLTVNALCAANGVVIPMQCEYYALEGLTQLMMTIRKVKQTYNSGLVILGILITMFNARLNLSVQVLDEIKKYYSDKLLSVTIPRSVKLTEAPSHGEPALYYDPYNKGTQAYTDAAKELLGRI